MSLTLSQLMPSAARTSLVAERFEHYEMRAVVFLYHQLGWQVQDLGEDAIRAAISQSYALSRQAGLRSESDHLKYLYAAGYWGIGFQTDPQYAAPLAEAGYHPPKDHTPAYLPIEPVLHALERWQQPLRHELARSQAVLHGLVDIAQSAPLSSPQLAARISALWPERAARLSGDDMLRFIEAAHGEYPEAYAAQNGQAVYAAIAFGLGIGFGRDPFLPWCRQAAMDGLELIQGLVDYWTLFAQAVEE